MYKIHKRNSTLVTIVILFIVLILTFSLGGCKWSSPPPVTDCQSMEELSEFLADENMWFFDLDFDYIFDIDETDCEKSEYFQIIGGRRGGGCTEVEEYFNCYSVGKRLNIGDEFGPYFKYSIRGYSSNRMKDFVEEYNIDGIPGMLSKSYVKDEIKEIGYKCDFNFNFLIDEKSYGISLEQYTWKLPTDTTDADDSVFGKIITKEIFLEAVTTAIKNRYQ